MDGGGGRDESYEGPVLITEGEWAGWRQWRGTDPFEDLAGPFYSKPEGEGRVRCAFKAEAKHMNGGGFMHGGCMMTFADFALFVISHEALGPVRGVTATFSSEFVGAAKAGDFMECTGEVVKAGKSLVFVRGLIETGGEPVMTFSGVIKKVGPRK